jgi:hypothetical protein
MKRVARFVMTLLAFVVVTCAGAAVASPAIRL